MKIDDNISVAKVLHKKTREQLLDEYADIKENSYYRIFSMSGLIGLVVLVKIFFPERESYLLPALFVFYLVLEIFLYMARLHKKLDMLYEIEKGRDSK